MAGIVQAKISVDDLVGYKPCAPWQNRRKIESYMRFQKNMPVTTFLSLPEFSVADRLWAVYRPEYLSHNEMLQVINYFLSVLPTSIDLFFREKWGAPERWEDLIQLTLQSPKHFNFIIWQTAKSDQGGEGQATLRAILSKIREIIVCREQV